MCELEEQPTDTVLTTPETIVRTFRTFDRTLGPVRRTTDGVVSTMSQQEGDMIQSTDLTATTALPALPDATDDMTESSESVASPDSTLSTTPASEGDIQTSARGDASTALSDTPLPATLSSAVTVPETLLPGDTADYSHTTFPSRNTTDTIALSLIHI